MQQPHPKRMQLTLLVLPQLWRPWMGFVQNPKSYRNVEFLNSMFVEFWKFGFEFWIWREFQGMYHYAKNSSTLNLNIHRSTKNQSRLNLKTPSSTKKVPPQFRKKSPPKEIIPPTKIHPQQRTISFLSLSFSLLFFFFSSSTFPMQPATTPITFPIRLRPRRRAV